MLYFRDLLILVSIKDSEILNVSCNVSIKIKLQADVC